MRKTTFHHIFSIVALAALLFLSGCGKDADDIKPSIKNLTSSKWIMQEMTSDDLDDFSLIIFAAFYDGYELTYHADGSYAMLLPAFGEDGAGEGTWELSSNDQLLIHDKDTEDENRYTVETISSTELVISFDSENEESGEVYNIAMHFKH